MYLEMILLLLHFTPTVIASLKTHKRLILKKLLPLPAPFQHFCFRVRFHFQPLSSKCFCFRLHIPALNIIVQSEHNQFNVNSIKNYLSSIKNKEKKAVFAYFHNDSCKVLGRPPKTLLDDKHTFMSYFFPK